jgi:hypothetical protein
VKSARAGESLAFEKNKKAASPENCTGLAAFFEEPTYLDHVNARTRNRFQYRPGANLSGARARNSALPGDLLKPALSLVVSGKAALVEPECCSVVIPATVDHSGGVFNVEHLMINNELHKPFGHLS